MTIESKTEKILENLQLNDIFKISKSQILFCLKKISKIKNYFPRLKFFSKKNDTQKISEIKKYFAEKTKKRKLLIIAESTKKKQFAVFAKRPKKKRDPSAILFSLTHETYFPSSKEKSKMESFFYESSSDEEVQKISNEALLRLGGKKDLIIGAGCLESRDSCYSVLSPMFSFNGEQSEGVEVDPMNHLGGGITFGLEWMAVFEFSKM